ncbi:MAG: GtrA family protein [Natronomonas sp.]|uniref:GtrA family protein n=1 Tax=Natronomonas salsuginis TaxID=2217661 RepID=A0A4U5JAX1_9EURY|nr:GtrA family protein [Natronomonas salsuginis]MDR9380136.1 GtrA family protein [Natronomonas sp.]TKR26342.1 GtrA family protein [Natronomonas salsuginis]
MDVRELGETLYAPFRFGRFASVGAVGAVCDNAVLLTLTTIGVLPELAKFAGIETAIAVMFVLNERWTFSDAGRAGLVPTLRRLATSNVVRIGGITVQLVVFSLVYRRLHVDVSAFGIDLWLLVASGAGIGLGMFVNYVTESLITWRIHRR